MNDFRRFDAGQAFLAGRAARDERILKSRLAGLASQAYGADPSAQDGLVQQAIALDPQAGYAIGAQAQQATQGREQRVGRLAVILSQAPDSLRPQLRRQMLPELRRMGIDIKDEEDEAERQIVQQLAALYGGGGQGKPAAMQVFEAQAAAAGLKPGTPEYQKAAQIALGLQGRASSAGMGLDMVEDANGVPRPQRFDPRTGGVEVYIAERGGWQPLGGGAMPRPPATPQNAPAPAGGDIPQTPMLVEVSAQFPGFRPTSSLRSPERNQQVDGVPNSFHLDGRAVDGYPASPQQRAEIGAWAAQRGLEVIDYPDGRVHIEPAPRGAAGGMPAEFGRGRPKEEESAAVEAARIAAQQAAAPRQAELDAGREAAITSARAEATAAGDRQVDQRAKNTSFAQYTAARDDLLSSLEQTATGPIAGRLPAMTGSQQIAEGAQARMAPILKGLFRTAGEGTFTDKDQELLMAMVPSRTDLPEAVRAKIAGIDAIVQAKLMQGQQSAPRQDAPPVEGARKAPDGNWYVQRNGQYFKVEP